MKANKANKATWIAAALFSATFVSSAFATMPDDSEEATWATSTEKCKSPTQTTDGLVLTDEKIIGLEWECDIVGDWKTFSDGSKGAILACSGEGGPVTNRIALIRKLSNGYFLSLDITGYHTTPTALKLCE